MATQAELGNALTECLREVSNLLEHAYMASKMQHEALAQNDVEKIATTSRSQEEVLRRISDVDKRAALIAEHLAIETGIDLSSSDAAVIADAAGFPYADLIKDELEKISYISQQVKEANEINKRLLENGLDVITCCLRTVANDNEPDLYSNSADITNKKAHGISVDRCV